MVKCSVQMPDRNTCCSGRYFSPFARAGEAKPGPGRHRGRVPVFNTHAPPAAPPCTSPASVASNDFHLTGKLFREAPRRQRAPGLRRGAPARVAADSRPDRPLCGRRPASRRGALAAAARTRPARSGPSLKTHQPNTRRADLLIPIKAGFLLRGHDEHVDIPRQVLSISYVFS